MAMAMGSLSYSYPTSVLYTCLFLLLLFVFLNIDFHYFIDFSSLLNPPNLQGDKNGDIQRLEQGLARARAAIKHINTSDPDPDPDPDSDSSKTINGSIYRNPLAFYQSYAEMEKRFKIWVYREGEVPLFHFGPSKEIYSIEGQLIDELETPGNHFVAADPAEAHAFFLPVSVVEIVEYLYTPPVNYDRGRLRNVVADYVRVVARKYPHWNRSSGADHFFVSCHDWGPDVSSGNPHLFKNMIRGLCNANVSEGFEPARDFSVPEIKVPSQTLGPPDLNQSPDNRTILAFFAGGAHGHVRKRLFQHWKDRNDTDMQVHEYLPKNLNYFELMSRSKYCLCPSGYEVASPRLIESMHAGCVPVIISDGYVLPFSEVLDWTTFSVHVPVARIPDIEKILEGIPRDEYLEKQRRVLEVKKHFVLHRPARRFDLLHMVLHSLWLRRLNFRLL